MAPTYAAPGNLGSLAPDFMLPGVDGKTYCLADFQNSKALVVSFICNHCPYVIAVQDRMNRLAKECRTQGVAWVGINSNDSVKYPDDSFEKMKERAKEVGYIFPYLRDETQEVAKAFGAVCTPEFYVYKKDPVLQKFVLKYQGRLDDSWKDVSAVTKQELSDAIAAVLADQEPNSEQMPAMGCSIKWK